MNVTRRLAAMMALLYAVQGAWWPLLAVHLRDLGISGRGSGLIFATLSLASLATPLGAGHLADRRMPTQRLLSWIFAIGTGFLVILATGAIRGTWPLFAVFLAYWLVTAPASGLCSSLALRNLPRPAVQFGGVRLWGTVGWMAVGWAVSAVLVGTGGTRAGWGAYEAFWVAAGLSVAFSCFCLTLPDTPPLAVGDRGKGTDLLDALRLARRPAVAAYLVAAFGVNLTTPFTYQIIPPYLETLGVARGWIASAMTLGQVPEIATLAVLPWLLRRLGYRGTLLLGVTVWVVRYGGLIGYPSRWLAVAGIPLHGLAVACFHIAGPMFLDEQAPFDHRAGAQALNTVVTSGIGSLLGNILAGELLGRAGGNYALVFRVPCFINVAMLVLLLIAFRPSRGVGPSPAYPQALRSSS